MKINDGISKQHHYPLTQAIHVLYIDIVEDNTIHYNVLNGHA